MEETGQNTFFPGFFHLPEEIDFFRLPGEIGFFRLPGEIGFFHLPGEIGFFHLPGRIGFLQMKPSPVMNYMNNKKVNAFLLPFGVMQQSIVVFCSRLL